MHIGIAVFIIILMVVFALGGALAAMITEDHLLTRFHEERQKSLAPTNVSPTWTVKQATVAYHSELGWGRSKHTWDHHFEVEVLCVRGHKTFRVGHYDARKDDVLEKVGQLVIKAEEKCANFNALEVE